MNKYYLNEGFKLSEYGLKLEERYILTEAEEDTTEQSSATTTNSISEAIDKALGRVNGIIKKLNSTQKDFNARDAKLKELSAIIDQADATADMTKAAGFIKAYITNIEDTIGKNNISFYPAINTTFSEIKNGVNKAKLSKTDVNTLISKLKTLQTALATNDSPLNTDDTVRQSILAALTTTKNSLEVLFNNKDKIANELADPAKIKDTLRLKEPLTALYTDLPVVKSIQLSKLPDVSETIITACKKFTENADIIAYISAIEKEAADKKAAEEKEAADKKAADKAAANANKTDWRGELEKAIKVSADEYRKKQAEFYQKFWGGNINSNFAKTIEYLGEAIRLELEEFGSNPDYNPFFKYIDLMCNIKRDEKDNIVTIGKPEAIANMTRNVYYAIHNAYSSGYIKNKDLNGQNKANILWAPGFQTVSGTDATNMLKTQKNILDSIGNYADSKLAASFYQKYNGKDKRPLLNYNIFVKGDLGANEAVPADYLAVNNITSWTTINQLLTDCFGEDVNQKADMADKDIADFINNNLFSNKDNIFYAINYIGSITDNINEIKKINDMTAHKEIGTIDFVEKIQKLLSEFNLTKQVGGKIIKALATKGEIK